MIIDFSSKHSRISAGSFYTAISRVKNGESVYLKSFEPHFIKANPAVESKLRAMETFSPYIPKKIYLEEEIFLNGSNEIKIGYININDIFASKSVSYLNNNANLLNLDLLAVSDTRLTQEVLDVELGNLLSNWNILHRFDSIDYIKHMGLILLHSKSSRFPLKSFVIDSKEGVKTVQGRQIVYVQAIRVMVEQLKRKIGFVYIRETPTKEEAKLIQYTFRNCSLIMGDINLDPNRSADVEKLTMICGLTLTRILHEPTTLNYNQLDHVIIDKKLAPFCFSTSFFNYTTDHRTITVRIPLSEKNSFSDNFLARINLKEDRPKPVSENLPAFKIHHIDTYIDLLRKIESDNMIFSLSIAQELWNMAMKRFTKIEDSLLDQRILEAPSVIFPCYLTEDLV